MLPGKLNRTRLVHAFVPVSNTKSPRARFLPPRPVIKIPNKSAAGVKYPHMYPFTYVRGFFTDFLKLFVYMYYWAGARAAHEEHEEHEQVIGTHKVRFWTGFHTIF